MSVSSRPHEVTDPNNPRTGPDSLWATVERWDASVDRCFEPLRGNAAADRLFYTASELADRSLIWHLLAAGKATISRSGHNAALRLTIALAIESGLVNGVIKSLFNRSRPTIREHRPLRLRIPRTASFPSGHASSATMAALLLGEGSRLGPVYKVAAMIVGASRIHVKIHHSSDVVGGAIVGAVLGRIVKKVRPLN